jgi:hypothetical protein
MTVSDNKIMRGNIRAAEERDIVQIADLHERLLGKRPENTSAALKASLQQVIFRNPWRNPAMPSLVFEQNDGSLAGFLGVVPRTMSINGRKITAATSHSFLVEPESRTSLAAIRLIKAYLSGPQDLSMAEGNAVSRKIWEGLGCTTSLLYSLNWTRPLQPVSYVLSALQRRGMFPALAVPLNYLCRGIDNSPLGQQGPFKLTKPKLMSEELDVLPLCNDLQYMCQQQSLLPGYDENTLTWLLEQIQIKSKGQRLCKLLLRNHQQEIVGWYIYCQTIGGVWKVLQLVATENYVSEVLAHLFYQAKQDGIVAISGYMDPRFFHALATSDCLFRHDGTTAWMMYYTRDPEIRAAIQQDRAMISRLDAEWWIGFLLE